MDTFERPPVDDEAERRILGCILRQPSLVYEGDVKAHWFWTEGHRHIWRAVERALSSNVDHDLVHAHAVYEINQEFSGYEITGRNIKTYTLQLMENCISPGPEFEIWAPKIRSAYIRRQVIAIGSRVSELARTEKDGDLVVREFADEGAKLAGLVGSKRSDIRGIADDWFSIIERRLVGDGIDSTRVLTDIDPLDALLGGGGVLGHYTVIMAQKKMGKSRLTTRIAYNLAQRGVNVLHFSEEMTSREMLWLYVTAHCGMSEKEFWEDTLKTKQEKLDIARKAKDEVATMPIQMHCGKVHIKEIILRTKAKMSVCDGAPLVVIVDYLQRIKADGDDDYSRVTHVTMELAGLAKDSGAWIIALAQPKRTEGSKMPTASDARSSGQIEQDVDEMVIYHRASENDADASPSQKAEGILWMCLNRHGETGKLPIFCDLGRLDFRRFDGYPI